MTHHEQWATGNEQRKTLYLIDGSGFIFRAYHALPPLTSADGTPIGAVHGFVNMIVKLRAEHMSAFPRWGKGGDSRDEGCPHPNPLPEGEGVYAAVIFDAARHTFRNRIYPEYKAHRPPAPEDLVPQFPIVREATIALGLPAIELADYEADDIIATYAKQARAAGMEVVIISSDKDLMQLIAPGVSMFDAMKNRSIGEAEVREKFGVGPDKVRHVLALMGDSSDNVPGVPGIGPKTAAELIGEYGDLETLLSRSGEIKQNKRRETIQNNTRQARISYELIGLKDDVPALPALESLATQPLVQETAVAFMQKYGLKTAMARMQGKSSEFGVQSSGKKVEKEKSNSPNSELRTPNSYSTVTSEAELAQWIARARKKGIVAFDTETTSLNALSAELVGFSLCAQAGEACYVPIGHLGSGIGDRGSEQDDLFSLSPGPRPLAPNQIPRARALELLKPLLEDDSVLKIGHNIKYDMLVMGNYGCGINAIEDTMLMSYCLHAGEHGQGMDELAERYLPPHFPPASGGDVRGGYKTISYDEITGTGKSRKRFDEVEIEKATQYAAEDADITLRLYELFKPQLTGAGMLTLYSTIEKPLIAVLARMEQFGIKVNVAKLAYLSKDFEGRLHVLEKEIQQLVGADFNVGSPKQLGEILFEKLQLPGGRKSAKSGAYSTDNDILEELSEAGYEVATKVIEWRQLSKLKSTYSDSLAEKINHKTGRVHTSFAQALTTTGRLSSSDPNLQNIPIRTIEGKKIREAFVAENGNVLLSADYSQIELRLLAHMADIDVLKTAFRNGDDIHAITAMQMFGEVNPDLRRSAKMINFGIIYGISAHGLATRLGIGRTEAAAYIGQYFQQYPGIRDYMETTKEFARKNGYVTTLFGRRCHLTGINDKNAGRRQFFERAAINAPLQGTAADIIKKAMIAIDRGQGSGIRGQNDLTSLSPDPRPPTPSFIMLLQVHDELVFELPESEVVAATPIIKNAMENAAKLSVPLTVEIGSGKHWREAH